MIELAEKPQHERDLEERFQARAARGDKTAGLALLNQLDRVETGDEAKKGRADSGETLQ